MMKPNSGHSVSYNPTTRRAKNQEQPMRTQTNFSGFPNETLQFLKNLAANNDRDWFKAHEEDYHHTVLEPAQIFVISLGERLKTISKGISYDPRTNGRGSILRIYRDIRFSRDKSPYNTRLRISFWEGSSKKTENPGYFFAMDANEGILYGGIYMFPKKVLETYRQAVLDRSLGMELEAAVESVRGAGKYEVGGDTYKRVPSGYPAGHPRARFLLYTGLFAASPKIEPEILTSPALVEACYQYALHMAPIHRWLVQLISNPDIG
jgi:uncharacterized protein (TIGR02453 family)